MKEFDAFISYSTSDTKLAESLERALERYRPPSQYNHKGRLNVFRPRDRAGGWGISIISELS
jgi:hypothetical protein